MKKEILLNSNCIKYLKEHFGENFKIEVVDYKLPTIEKPYLCIEFTNKIKIITTEPFSILIENQNKGEINE